MKPPPEITQQMIDASPAMRAVLRKVYEYLSAIPESAAGGDDDAVRLARIVKAVIAKADGK